MTEAPVVALQDRDHDFGRGRRQCAGSLQAGPREPTAQLSGAGSRDPGDRGFADQVNGCGLEHPLLARPIADMAEIKNFLRQNFGLT